MAALYDTIGGTYGRYRQPDPRIQRAIDDALGDAARVVNVGAGTGSYEPRDRDVIAVEPSLTMIAQRARGAAPVVQATAERLPFRDQTFDAAMALLTMHHWPDAAAGLREAVRVARRQLVLTWEPAAIAKFWLITDYVPEIAPRDAGLASLNLVMQTLRVDDVVNIPVPRDCADGFCGAYWNRPEMYLDDDARAAISAFATLDDGIATAAMTQLARDIESGAWDDRYGELRALDEMDLGYRLVVASGARA